MAVRFQRLAVAFTFAALLAACNGGSTNVNPPAAPSPTPGAVATATVASASTSATFNGGGTTSTAFLFPTASAGVGSTLTLTGSTTAPNGVTGASTHRSVRDVSTVLEYVLVTSTAAATFSGTPALTFVLPSSEIVTGATYTLEVYSSTDSSAGFVTIATGTLSGSTLSFPAGIVPFTVPATPAYVVFALKSTVISASPSPSPSVSPSPSPSASPSPSPSPSPTVSPGPGASPTPAPTEPPGTNTISANAAILVFAAPTASPQSFVITETNGAALIESDTCSGTTPFASISPTGTTRPAVETLTVTVTPLSVGTCAVTYQDPAGNHVTVQIAVSNPAPIVIQ